MKTTIDIRDDLLAAATARAEAERTTVENILEQGLALRLRKVTGSHALRPLPVSRHDGGLLPGIDPCSNRSMLDAADGP